MRKLQGSLIHEKTNLAMYEKGTSQSSYARLGLLLLLLLLLSRFSRVRLCARQPTRLFSPWDSPGKNTGVGCHCLLRRFIADLLNTCKSVTGAGWGYGGE